MSGLIDAISAGFELAGDDYRWGFRVCREGGRSSRDFVWPMSGPVAASGPFYKRSPCPSQRGDGICLATTWQGIVSACLPAELFLLAAYRSDDVLGADADKVRVKAAVVVASWSAAELVRMLSPIQATLAGAYLNAADLRGADLRGVNLRGAYLSNADLSEADLSGTHLYGAVLSEADLIGANLAGVNLARASLDRADLTGANLIGANLHIADLSGADLTGADLRNARLSGANLADADLRQADLTGVDLTDVDLTGVDLTGVDLPDAVI